MEAEDGGVKGEVGSGGGDGEDRRVREVLSRVTLPVGWEDVERMVGEHCPKYYVDDFRCPEDGDLVFSITYLPFRVFSGVMTGVGMRAQWILKLKSDR